MHPHYSFSADTLLAIMTLTLLYQAGRKVTHPGTQVTQRRVQQGEDVVLKHQLHLLPVQPLL